MINLSKKHRQRLIFVLFILTAVSLAVSVALFALKQNINLFFTPTQAATGQAPLNHQIRLGGLVVQNSIQHLAKSTEVTFAVTDQKHSIRVKYSGILPALFRDGQGVVVLGKIINSGQFVASEVLAKHDEKYVPPEVTARLKESHFVT